MSSVIVMMLYYTAGTAFSSLPVTTIQGFTTITACETAMAQVKEDFTLHPYGPKGKIEVPVTKCFAYAAS